METIERKFDPRAKLIVIIYLTTLGIFIKNIFTLIYVLAVTILLACISKVDIFSSLGRIKKIFYIVVLIVFIQSMFLPSENTILALGSIKILTVEGLNKGIEFLLRISIIITSATILSTSNSREIIQGLVQMKIPYEIAFMVSIGIKFLPMFSQELKDVYVAIQLKGIEIDKLSFRKKISLYSYIFTPVILRTINKAEKLSISMDSRGFRATKTRSSYMILQMDRRDYLFIIGGIVLGSISLIFI